MRFRIAPEEIADFGNMMDDLSQSAGSSGRGDLDEVGISLDGDIGAALGKPLATVSSTLNTMTMSRITVIDVPRREQP